jgi:hypothetical protein
VGVSLEILRGWNGTDDGDIPAKLSAKLWWWMTSCFPVTSRCWTLQCTRKDPSVCKGGLETQAIFNPKSIPILKDVGCC